VETFFLVCALLGGGVVLLQLLLGAVGLAGEAADLDLGTDAKDALNLLSVRSLSAGLAFFGIAGLAALSAGLSLAAALPVALAAGAAGMIGVAALMRSLLRLQSDGTVRLENAVGQPATVYLKIPGERAGMGRVLLTVQNRTVECQAVTALEELPTGASVVVVDVIGPDTVEVAPTPDFGGILDA
jgi:hypothetical protein